MTPRFSLNLWVDISGYDLGRNIWVEKSSNGIEYASHWRLTSSETQFSVMSYHSALHLSEMMESNAKRECKQAMPRWACSEEIVNFHPSNYNHLSIGHEERKEIYVL